VCVGLMNTNEYFDPTTQNGFPFWGTVRLVKTRKDVKAVMMYTDELELG